MLNRVLSVILLAIMLILAVIFTLNVWIGHTQEAILGGVCILLLLNSFRWLND